MPNQNDSTGLATGIEEAIANEFYGGERVTHGGDQTHLNRTSDRYIKSDRSGAPNGTYGISGEGNTTPSNETEDKISFSKKQGAIAKFQILR